MFTFINKEAHNIYTVKAIYSHPDTSSKVIFKTVTFDNDLITGEGEVSAEGEGLINALWEGNEYYHDLTIEVTSIFDFSEIEEIEAFIKQVIVIASYWHGVDNEVIDIDMKRYRVVAKG